MQRLPHRGRRTGSSHLAAALSVPSLIFFGATYSTVRFLNKEFVPAQDQSRFLVTLQTPLGSSMDFTNQVFTEAEKMLKQGDGKVINYSVNLCFVRLSTKITFSDEASFTVSNR